MRLINVSTMYIEIYSLNTPWESKLLHLKWVNLVDLIGVVKRNKIIIKDRLSGLIKLKTLCSICDTLHRVYETPNAQRRPNRKSKP